MSLTTLSCDAFSEKLFSKEPVPGGGGAAALVGALAASLAGMVGNYTTGKKTYAAYEDDIKGCLASAEASRAALISLVDEDAAAFEPLSRAYGIPKGSEGRDEALEEATKAALLPPLKMARQIAALVDVLEVLGEKGSKMLRSDVGCGVYLAAAALRCAAMNVSVNTRTLADRAYAAEVDAEVAGLLAAAERADALGSAVAAGFVKED
jgi:methenyltetrahydrofolate cyclohydrolase